MAANTPISGKISWPAVIIQLIVIGLLIYVYHLAGFGDSFIFAALTYALLALVLRKAIAKNHRQGMRLVLQQKFAEAIPYFEKSVDYFTKNNWVDKYRYLTLLSSSKMTYKEMGLCNMAFCFSQTGNGQQAKKYYELVLSEFPENGLAVAGLNMLQSNSE